MKTPEPQKLVPQGLEESLKGVQLAPSLRGAAMSPAFCYHIGDVVYYNGEVDKYYDQYYEPYETYPLPILAILGNHDGEPLGEGAPPPDPPSKLEPVLLPADHHLASAPAHLEPDR